MLAALDWLLIGDRKRLPLSRLWLVLIYPATWLTVVLIRGATDGWVPYPFLDPANGYGSIAIVCVGICVAMLLVGLVFVWRSFYAMRIPLDAVEYEGALQPTANLAAGEPGGLEVSNGYAPRKKIEERPLTHV